MLVWLLIMMLLVVVLLVMMLIVVMLLLVSPVLLVAPVGVLVVVGAVVGMPAFVEVRKRVLDSDAITDMLKIGLDRLELADEIDQPGAVIVDDEILLKTEVAVATPLNVFLEIHARYLTMRLGIPSLIRKMI